ncbi:MAG: hypothetical protein AB8H03_10205 [Saprospiraceae bacterium]
MAKKEQLFSLIQSLTQAEKRYFKIFCFSQKVDNNYLKLFELMVKQVDYDEEKIRKKFKGERFLKQLHVTKNYLYQLLLKSLRNYHSTISADAEIKSLLRNVEILFVRELYEASFSELRKVEKLATKFENQTALLEIINWKKKFQLTKSGTDVESLQELIAKEKKIIEGIVLQNENWELTSDVFRFFKSNKKRLEIFLQKKPPPNASLQHQILFYNLDYIFHVINGEPKKGLASLDLMIDLFERNPARIKDDPSSYARVMNNKVSYFIFQKQYIHVLPLLKKIRAIPTTYQLKNAQKFSIKLQLRTYNIELEMYRDLKQFEKGINVISQAKRYLLENEKIIPADYHVMLRYQFAYIYFMQKNYSNSLKWVNEIIQTPFKNYRKDLQSYARVLNLMIHFELGNIIVLKYAVENCRRFLKKSIDFRGQPTVLPFAKVLLHFFSKICNAPHSHYSQLFEKLKMDLVDAEPQILNDDILDYLDIKSWLVEKLK